ncbi:FbpB family small basic protein [Sporolactobacillus spathodeae]|uniref:FbpB family small basic protein n=1 Tax=Sporolactobacillus spathodeae TaxID=1465502 RepID=A0ABS2QD46_9BACL|nr:FbpB family small basic protein [Sporolactobacillus spathodeae]MBM7658857.1 hypothetical protein [Sporolactobacillus spathodeae]
MKKKYSFEELMKINKLEILDSEKMLEQIEEKIEKRHDLKE